MIKNILQECREERIAHSAEINTVNRHIFAAAALTQAMIDQSFEFDTWNILYSARKAVLAELGVQ